MGLPASATLCFVAVDADASATSRSGAITRRRAVPHLYGELALKAVHRVDPPPLDETGRHAFPRFVLTWFTRGREQDWIPLAREMTGLRFEFGRGSQEIAGPR